MRYTPYGIAFTGGMHSGKDTAADILVRHYEMRDTGDGGIEYLRYRRTAFADPLKEICMSGFGLTHEQCYTQNGKQEYLPRYHQTVRQFLQNVGQAMRDHVDKDIWVTLMAERLQADIVGKTFFIITDVRYDNEARLVRDHGGLVVRIARNTGIADSHPSEQPVSWSYIDETVVNNGSLGDFQDKLTGLFERTLDLSAFYASR